MIERIRTKPKGILAMFMLLLTLLFIPTAFATGDDEFKYNGGEGGVENGTGVSVEIVHSWQNPPKGYRFYAIKENGQKVSDIRDLWFGGAETLSYVREQTTPTRDLELSVYNLNSRATNGVSTPWGVPLETLFNSSGNNQIPEPFSGFSGNGNALEAWIYATEEGADMCNGLRIIRTLFGSDVIEEYINGEEELYIVIEALTMFDMLDEHNQRVGVFAGSAYNWSFRCDQLVQPYGNSWLRRGTNGTFGLCLMLEETWEVTNTYGNMVVPTYRKIPSGAGASDTSAWLSSKQLRQFGYGTHEYTFSSLMTQTTHTWDYPLGSTPGPAPKVEEDLEDKVGIVKVYCTKDPETGSVISWDGSYFRDNNPRTIVVEDEPEYKVEEWYTSKVKGTSAPGTWPGVKGMYIGVIQGPSGGPGTVILDPDKPTFERTLCVLLVRYPEEVEVESNLIIEESEISIYRLLSEVSDFNLADTKIKWSTGGISGVTCTYPVKVGESNCSNIKSKNSIFFIL